MKLPAKTITALVCAACLAAPAFAGEKTHKPPMGGMGHGMGNMTEEQMDAHLRRMQERMLVDYGFMRQINDAKDENEKTRLKDEWLKAMKEHMRANQVPQQLKMHGAPDTPAETPKQ